MKKTDMNYLSKKYRFFLFDQWGVLHNGNKIFKYTNKSLKRIKDKKLILISNTSQTLVEFKTQTLKKINLKLWIIEDDKRQCEKDKDFTEKFIKLSRDIHFLNDERAKIKLEINNLTGSKIREIKEYTNY